MIVYMAIFPYGFKNAIEYQYFSRYRIEMGNSSILTTLVPGRASSELFHPLHLHRQEKPLENN